VRTNRSKADIRRRASFKITSFKITSFIHLWRLFCEISALESWYNTRNDKSSCVV